MFFLTLLYQYPIFLWHLEFFYFIGRSTLVGQRPMKTLSSVNPSVRPSLSFLKIGSLVFFDIVHHDSWPWLTEPDFREKFLKFSSLVFLEFACNDSLQQCLTSSRGKVHEKIFRPPNFGLMGQVWFISFPVNYIGW